MDFNSATCCGCIECRRLGVLGVGFAPDEFFNFTVEETKKLTDKPFGINTVMIPENLDRLTGHIKNLKPPVVYADTLLGLDVDLCKKYFSQWHEAGCKIIVKASDIADAVNAEIGGADLIIVKGWEGGGHTTVEATTVLVPHAADKLSIPVVASGGIADGRGMAAAIALGAEGIEMGTVFMASKETTVHPNVKRSVIEAGDMSTVITGYSTVSLADSLKMHFLMRWRRSRLRIQKSQRQKSFAPLLKVLLREQWLRGYGTWSSYGWTNCTTYQRRKSSYRYYR